MKWPWVSWKRVAELQQQLDDLKALETAGLRMDGSSLDMSVKGPMVKILAGLWVDFFHQNGGDNFVTMTMHMRDPWWKLKNRKNHFYEVTVQRVGGESPAEQLIRVKAENAGLRAGLKAGEG